MVAFGKPAEVAPGVDDSAVDIGTTSLILGEEGRSIGLGAGAGVAVVVVVVGTKVQVQAKNRTGTGTTRSNQTIPTKRLTPLYALTAMFTLCTCSTWKIIYHFYLKDLLPYGCGVVFPSLADLKLIL